MESVAEKKTDKSNLCTTEEKEERVQSKECEVKSEGKKLINQPSHMEREERENAR